MKITVQYFLFFIFCCASGWVNGQDIQERLFVDVNNTLFISGETMYFSIFNTSAKTGKLTSLTKLTYVELIGEDGVAFQQKIPLEDGTGAGSFFINSLLPTGHYQLLAHTRWMKNFDDYFELDIIIVNPYENYSLPEEFSNNPQLHLSITDNQLYTKTEQQIGFQLTDGYSKALNYRGRVIEKGGTTLSDINTIKDGYGYFSLLPIPGKKYQLIFEDDDQTFHFFDLPIDELINGQPPKISSPKLTRKIKPIDELVTSCKPRQKVSIPVNLPRGTYTVSVKLQQHQLAPFAPRSIHSEWWDRLSQPYDKAHISPYPFEDKILFQNINHYKKKNSIPDLVKWLPEHRNELCTGKVSNASGTPFAEKSLLFSIPGKNFQVRSIRTDKKGQFTVHFESPHFDMSAYLFPIDSTNSLQFQIDDPFIGEAKNFEFKPVILDSTTILELVNRGIHSQIENAYFVNHQPDTTRQKEAWPPQFTHFDFSYRLDDYARFKTLSEHFTEYILGAKVRSNQVKLLVSYTEFVEDNPSLILIDGMLANATEILNYNPYNIERISILPSRIIFGELYFDGFMSIETFDGTADGYKLQPNHRFELKGLSLPPTIYDTNILSPIEEPRPDRRTQLLWLPNYKSIGEPTTINFVSSDVTGNFEVVINGIDENGIPHSYEGLINVALSP